MARVGLALLVVGVLLMAYAGAWQLGLAPGSRLTVPPPVAQTQPSPAITPTSVASIPTSAPATVATAVADATPVSVPAAVTPTAAPSVPAVPADALDRSAPAPEPGYAVHLAIPSIKLDTAVEPAGIVPDKNGNPSWQTLPFVAVQYGEATSLLGVPGNAVIAGHVVTLNEGNVFRFLYQVELDDQIAVWDQLGREHDYHVVGAKLVPPTDISVMAPTPDETLTLITCGGTFDPRTREFSDRLIVTAKPDSVVPGSR